MGHLEDSSQSGQSVGITIEGQDYKTIDQSQYCNTYIIYMQGLLL